MKSPLVMSAFALVLLVLTGAPPASAAPVPVRFTEGVIHGFPVLRSPAGEPLATGEMTQVARGAVVESRLVFRFRDGSVYDESVVFSQVDAFTLESYHLVQRGPSFPESVDATLDRKTGRYDVRYRADDESPEERVSGSFALPADVYSGMLGILLKNLAPGQKETVHVVVFTPRPRLVKVLLAPAADELLTLGGRPISTTRYLIKPELGLLASLLVVAPAPIHLWVIGGDAPAFVKFEGPLYFMGPVWRIDLN